METGRQDGGSDQNHAPFSVGKTGNISRKFLTIILKIFDKSFGRLHPRFILQPVVENAIIHGVEPLDRRGAISIRGYLQDEKILFVITDNGVGMEKEQVEKMLNNRCNIEKGRFSGVGIGNVNSRMQLIFGEQYGLTIKSEKNMFTSVVISFPKVQSGEDNCE